jgi:hypothetical protein
VVVAPNAGVLEAPNAGVLEAPNGEVDPNRLLLNAGCVCPKLLPNGLDCCGVVAPKPPKAGFCPNAVLPKEDCVLPKAGVDEAPKVGVELPNAGDDEAPNTPVDVPPKSEVPVCDPNGFVLPNGFGANGLLLFALLFCPKTDCVPNGLPDDCPKGEEEPNIFISAV